jgi:hypothetical protein
MRRREAVLTGTAAAWAVRKPYRPARHCQAQAVSTVPYSTLQLQCGATIQRPRKDVRQPSRKREGRSSTRLAPLPRPKVVALPLALATWRGKGRSEGPPQRCHTEGSLRQAPESFIPKPPQLAKHAWSANGSSSPVQPWSSTESQSLL